MTVSARAYRALTEFDERLAVNLQRSDPVADAVVRDFAQLKPGVGNNILNLALRDGIRAVSNPPDSLVQYFAWLDELPLWVDLAEIDYGASAFMRIGSFGASALMCHSLPTGYLDPASSKPLVFSGRLITRAPRRLIETARFVYECAAPGGLRRSGRGFAVSARVRLMHAQVRRLLLRSGKWDQGAWGLPISQYHLLGTNALFSLAVVDAVRRWGVLLSAREEHAMFALWRYNGYLMGIDPGIAPANAAECRRILAAVESMRPAADDMSRQLTSALMEAGAEMSVAMVPILSQKMTVGILSGFTRSLLGRGRADELALPRTFWRFLPLLLRPLVRSLEILRLFVPYSRRLAVRLGRRAWEAALQAGLRGRDASFALPNTLSVDGNKD